MKKYVLHPGFVISQTDGQEHHITARQLANLYEVDFQECFIADNMEISLRSRPELIHLYPKYDGKYREELEGYLKARGEM